MDWKLYKFKTPEEIIAKFGYPPFHAMVIAGIIKKLSDVETVSKDVSYESLYKMADQGLRYDECVTECIYNTMRELAHD